MTKEEMKDKIIKILTKNLVNGYDAMNEHIPVINESQIPFIADEIVGLHFFDVVRSIDN